MNYQLIIEGAVSTELTHLLNAVERQLNWHAIHAQSPGETSAAALSGSQHSEYVQFPCPDGVGPHGPNSPNCIRAPLMDMFLYVGIGTGLIVGFFLCRCFKRKSSNAPGTR